MSEHRVIGQRLPRPDAIPRVTGEAVYTDDITFPGMLHGAVARSPHARARILQIDTSQAEALPGVRAVLTPDNCDLFSTEIFYPGQKIAAVAAVDRHTAREAVALIEVEYETLPSICDPLLAMEPDAPQVHPSKHPDHNNVCSFQRKERGDVEAGFARAEVVVEQTYQVGAAHQAYLEPHACVARFDNAGDLTVWTSVQGQFVARSGLSQILGLPLRSVRIVVPEIGGAFGGKTALIMEPI
ncbi:MAG: xanthine dehydrogenase family protein molybdopterin-binding subunit, partial [Gemmatimonadetes bacterium]|nr:xanthine dehydrogenase family protein molybdopterin-binding subunit [Gemmatimonadota bacterium]